MKPVNTLVTPCYPSPLVSSKHLLRLLTVIPSQPQVFRNSHRRPTVLVRPEGDLALIGHNAEADVQDADPAVTVGAGGGEVEGRGDQDVVGEGACCGGVLLDELLLWSMWFHTRQYTRRGAA